MHLPTTLLTLLFAVPLISALTPQNEKREVAAGGGGPVAAPVATQFPTTSLAMELVVVGGKTVETQRLFTQTFAATALGTWALGPTPAVGVIGLGDIKGEVGKVGK